jgi:hypothetical protein
VSAQHIVTMLLTTLYDLNIDFGHHHLIITHRGMPTSVRCDRSTVAYAAAYRVDTKMSLSDQPACRGDKIMATSWMHLRQNSHENDIHNVAYNVWGTLPLCQLRTTRYKMAIKGSFINNIEIKSEPSFDVCTNDDFQTGATEKPLVATGLRYWAKRFTVETGGIERITDEDRAANTSKVWNACTFW